MKPKIDLSKYFDDLKSGDITARAVAEREHCCREVVYRRCKAAGISLKGIKPVMRKAQTFGYLAWARAGCPTDVRQNEGLSSVGGQLGCDRYSKQPFRRARSGE